MFFNFIKNTKGGVLKHWIYKFSAKPPVADTVNSKLLFMVDILLYVVSNTVVFAVSSALTLNSEKPLTLSAFVWAVNVILTLSTVMLIAVSLVNGGVIIPKLSIENNTVSGGFPLLPVISSEPQPARNAQARAAAMSAYTIYPNVLLSYFKIVLMVIVVYLLKNSVLTFINQRKKHAVTRFDVFSLKYNSYRNAYSAA